MQCVSCKTENRVIAKYCKMCGAALAASPVSLGLSIDELVGLNDLKKRIAGIAVNSGRHETERLNKPLSLQYHSYRLFGNSKDPYFKPYRGIVFQIRHDHQEHSCYS